MLWNAGCFSAAVNQLKAIIFSFLAFSSLLLSADVSADLTFTLQPGSQTTLTGNISGSSSGSDSAQITGSYTATVVFDPETLEVKNFSFTGGSLSMGDLDLSFSGNVNVIGFGRVFLSVQARTQDLRETVTTPSPPGTVTSTGSLVASEHLITLNDGKLTLIASAGGESETEVTNYATNPNSEPASGTASISVVRSASDDFEETYVFTLLTETNDSITDNIDGTTNSMTLAGTETTESTASLTLRTDLGSWVDEQGVSEDEIDGSNQFGLPYRLLHAFDLESDSSGLPIAMGSNQNVPEVVIDLPSSGLRTNLFAHYRASLSDADWSNLPSGNYPNGTGLIEKNGSGEYKLTFPVGSAGFIRLSDEQLP